VAHPGKGRIKTASSLQLWIATPDAAMPYPGYGLHKNSKVRAAQQAQAHFSAPISR
jgi:hypothetical protein